MSDTRKREGVGSNANPKMNKEDLVEVLEQQGFTVLHVAHNCMELEETGQKIYFLEKDQDVIVWSLDDFKYKAFEIIVNNEEKYLNYKKPYSLDIVKEYFDLEKMEEEFNKMIVKHDSSIGINWDVISEHLERCYNGKEKEKTS